MIIKKQHGKKNKQKLMLPLLMVIKNLLLVLDTHHVQKVYQLEKDKVAPRDYAVVKLQNKEKLLKKFAIGEDMINSTSLIKTTKSINGVSNAFQMPKH
jgi:hypothetical protein